MNEGQIVEYIDDQKIICAAVLEQKKNRLRILNENNREVNLSEKRVSLISDSKISLKNSRDHIAKTLKDYAQKKEEIAKEIDIPELWDVLNSESDWLDVDTVAELNFGDEPSADEKSGIMRAMFYDKLYFKFNHNQYMPFTKKQVDQLILQKEEEERKKRIIEHGSNWLRENIKSTDPTPPPQEIPVIEIISSYYLHENESNHYETAKEIFKNAGVEPGLKIFKFLVKLGVWEINENTDLLKYQIEKDFSKKVCESVKDLLASDLEIDLTKRKDFRNLKTFTIDGASTRDYDDSLSFEIKDDKKIAYVHITDVDFYIKKNTPIDRNAASRGSSVYMPDLKIPMLHKSLSEDIASLVSDTDKPSISIIMELNKDYSLNRYEISPSVINVSDQITYNDADRYIEEGSSQELKELFEAAKKFRLKRFESHAVSISIPDSDVYINNDDTIEIKVLDRETPAWLLVSEFMIKANSLMADFLKVNNIPAIYRGQGKPEKRYYEGDKGTLLQQLLQRKEMSRVIVSTKPEPHCGLGVNTYITCTSPIRKYHDLICQRQIKSFFGIGGQYTEDELSDIINMLENTNSGISRVQFSRKRYWMLKFLESKRGEKEPAMVINEIRNSFSIILLNYMIECRLPASPGLKLKQGDNISVTIQNVNARSDILSVHLN